MCQTTLPPCLGCESLHKQPVPRLELQFNQDTKPLLQVFKSIVKCNDLHFLFMVKANSEGVKRKTGLHEE